MKIGGSVFTDKSTSEVVLHEDRIHRIAQILARYHAHHALVLVLGGGGVAHHMARRYALHPPGGKNAVQQRAVQAGRKRITAQMMRVSEILRDAGVPIQAYHTADIVAQDAGEVTHCDISTIADAIARGQVPLLSATMVPDSTWDWSICSGDTIATHVGAALHADCVAFATDVAGIYTADPHTSATAQLLARVSLAEQYTKNIFDAGESHHVDVTGGLGKKISSLTPLLATQQIGSSCIFDGRTPAHYAELLTGQTYPGTTIVWQ